MYGAVQGISQTVTYGAPGTNCPIATEMETVTVYKTVCVNGRCMQVPVQMSVPKQKPVETKPVETKPINESVPKIGVYKGNFLGLPSSDTNKSETKETKISAEIENTEITFNF